jgi:hypothetical protein
VVQITRRKKESAKSLAQKKHAKRNALKRFNVPLTKEVRAFIMEQIRTGKAITIERRSLRTPLKLVKLPDGRLARVVYDKLRHTIVTFIKPVEGDEKIYENGKSPRSAHRRGSKGTLQEQKEITKELKKIFKDETD